MTLGPDELVYQAQAQTVREHGPVRGIRMACDRFLSERSEHYPSPLRWLWVWLYAVAGKWSIIASAVLVPTVVWIGTGSVVAAMLSATSPLMWQLAGRRLQDVPVAMAVLLSLSGDPWWSAVAMLVALAMKEGAVLFIPAVVSVTVASGAGGTSTVLAMASAVAVYLALSRMILGRDFADVVRSIAGAHDTEYARRFQRGMPHRFLVDLALCSPVSLVAWAAVCRDWTAVGFVAIATLVHCMSPVMNIRTLLCVDIVIRASLGASLGHDWPLVFAVMAADLMIFRELRSVYDPTTSALTRALGMA